MQMPETGKHWLAAMDRAAFWEVAKQHFAEKMGEEEPKKLRFMAIKLERVS